MKQFHQCFLMFKISNKNPFLRWASLCKFLIISVNGCKNGIPDSTKEHQMNFDAKDFIPPMLHGLNFQSNFGGLAIFFKLWFTADTTSKSNISDNIGEVFLNGGLDPIPANGHRKGSR